MDEIKIRKPSFDISAITPLDVEQSRILEESELKFRAEQKRQSLEAHFRSKASGVGKRYQNATLAGFVPQTKSESAALDAVRAYISEPSQRGNLLMCGNYGTQKTFLGCCIVRQFGGTIVPALKLVVEYQSAANFASKRTQKEVLEHYSELPMLVIDECGRGIKSELEREVVNYIANERYANLLPMVIITNLSIEEYADFIGKPLIDRLNETCVSCIFDGQSRRLPQIQPSTPQAQTA